MTWAEERVKELARQLSRVDGIQYDRYLVPHMSDEVELFERVLRDVGLVEILNLFHLHATKEYCESGGCLLSIMRFEQALKEKRA